MQRLTREEWQEMQRKRHEQETLSQYARAAIAEHLDKIQGVEAYYGHAFGPGTIKVYVYWRNGTNHHQVDDLKKKIKNWCKDRRIKKIEVLLIEEAPPERPV